MDYEFTTDLLGRPLAHCSMDHEALGYWLTSELGGDLRRIDILLDAIANLRQRKLWEYDLEGAEYLLQLSPEEAIVRANSLGIVDDELDGEMNYYEAESVAHCGLEDFQALLTDWRQFAGTCRAS